MPQPLRTLTPLMSPWDLLGAQIRHWRICRGLSQRELGDLSHDSAALICKVEKAQRRPGRDLVQRLDTVLGARGALVELWVQASASAPGRTPETMPATLVASGSPVEIGHAGERRGRIGPADVDALSVMARAFADADHRCGGAHIRVALEEYLASTVRPIVSVDCPEHLRGDLLTAAAQVLDVAGFTAFDSGDLSLASQRYSEALDLVRVAGNGVMSGHVLTDLAMLALEQRSPNRAADYARSAERAARDGGSRATQARALAVLGRAHAAGGDSLGRDRAFDDARRVLAAVDRASEPDWVGFFDVEQLATESVYALAATQRPDQIEQLAAAGMRRPTVMHRRQLLLTLTVAASYCRLGDGAEGTPWGRDLDRACEVVVNLLRTCGVLASARVLALLDDVRRAIRSSAPTAVADELDAAIAVTLHA